MRQRQFLVQIFFAIVIRAFSLAPSRPFPQLEIHRAIENLKSNKFSYPKYQPKADEVVQILEQWSRDYSAIPEWNSLLNKANLQHELEESIVALHHLHEWKNLSSSTQSFVALDACCGKGIFSTLLSYLPPGGLERIILFDKDQKVNWKHIDAANTNHEQEGRPFLEAWAGTNLHDRDDLVEKLAGYNLPIAVTGIHLCKTLSPTLVGIVNVLGPTKAPYLCLAPCCLPRRNQKLQIALYEAPLQRQARIAASRHRKRLQQRRCFVCQGSHHVKDCPQKEQYTTEGQWNRAVYDAQRRLPCWKCGKIGHKSLDCTEPTLKPVHQPTTILEMTSSIYPSEEDPSLSRYCEALALTLGHSTTVIDSGLTTTSHVQQERPGNWNRNRKSLFILATATNNQESE